MMFSIKHKVRSHRLHKLPALNLVDKHKTIKFDAVGEDKRPAVEYIHIS